MEIRKLVGLFLPDKPPTVIMAEVAVEKPTAAAAEPPAPIAPASSAADADLDDLV